MPLALRPPLSEVPPGLGLLAQKTQLRARMRSLRRGLPVEDRHRRSAAASARLCRSGWLEGVTTLAGFAAFGSEADPAVALNAKRHAGCVVVWPRVVAARRPRLRWHRVADAWVHSPLGIDEPAGHEPELPAAALDAIVVPGLAFDARGGRLGAGGGYYDELIAALPPHARRPRLIGFAYDFQIVASCPMGPDDARVHYVVTDRRLIACGEHGASS